jgi:hypothetical protein
VAGRIGNVTAACDEANVAAHCTVKPPAVIFTQLANAGSALTLNGEPVVVASEHLLRDHLLVYFPVLTNLNTAGLRELHFEGYSAPDEQRVEFIRSGKVIATLQPIAAVGPECEETWGAWLRWHEANYLDYYEAVTAALRAHDPET